MIEWCPTQLCHAHTSSAVVEECPFICVKHKGGMRAWPLNSKRLRLLHAVNANYPRKLHCGEPQWMKPDWTSSRLPLSSLHGTADVGEAFRLQASKVRRFVVIGWDRKRAVCSTIACTVDLRISKGQPEVARVHPDVTCLLSMMTSRCISITRVQSGFRLVIFLSVNST